LRLPWGIGFGTLRACVRIAFGLRKSGVASAGNGAAMRAAIVGAFFFDLPKAARHEWSDALARVTHTDARAVEGARFVAELAARCVELGPLAVSPAVAMDACHVVTEPSLRGAIEHAIARSHEDVGAEAAAIEIGTTGFVLHSVAIATFCFLRFGHDPGLAVAQAVRAGGDTDSNAAIVGAWMGAAHGLSGLPGSMVRDLQSGPFGRRHLEALGGDLLRAREGSARRVAAYSWPVALVRILALYPIVLLHAFRVVGRR
jgi:ADP-ribosylglycohydrolase